MHACMYVCIYIYTHIYIHTHSLYFTQTKIDFYIIGRTFSLSKLQYTLWSMPTEIWGSTVMLTASGRYLFPLTLYTSHGGNQVLKTIMGWKKISVNFTNVYLLNAVHHYH